MATTAAPRASLSDVMAGVAATEETAGPPAKTAETEQAKADALRKASQNPVGSLVSVQFQTTFGWNVGFRDNEQVIMNFQPVIPVGFSENWNVILRPIVPFISNPTVAPGVSAEAGIANTVFQAYFTPKKVNKFIWGLGPALLIPTSTDDRWERVRGAPDRRS